MQVSKERLPVLLQAPGAMMRSEPWGGMAVSYVQLAKGTDFTPLLNESCRESRRAVYVCPPSRIVVNHERSG